MLIATEKNDYRMTLSVKFASALLHKSGTVKRLMVSFSHLTNYVVHNEAILDKVANKITAGINQLVESVAATYYASTITDEDMESFISLLESDIGSKFMSTVINNSENLQPIISSWMKDVETAIARMVYVYLPINYSQFVPKVESPIDMEEVYGITKLLPKRKPPFAQMLRMLRRQTH